MANLIDVLETWLLGGVRRTRRTVKSEETNGVIVLTVSRPVNILVTFDLFDITDAISRDTL